MFHHDPQLTGDAGGTTPAGSIPAVLGPGRACSPATTWWRPTAASSPSEATRSADPPVASGSTPRSWGWPWRRPPAATGWWPPTAVSSPSGAPGSTAPWAVSTSTHPSWAWRPRPDGDGYWLVAADGGSSPSATPVLRVRWGASTSTSTGRGDVRHRPTARATGWWPPTAASSPSGMRPSSGRPGGSHLNEPVVGTTNDTNTGGYWLVASDGGVFTFGGAPFFGSTGATSGSTPPSWAWPRPPTGAATDWPPPTAGVFSFSAPGRLLRFRWAGPAQCSRGRDRRVLTHAVAERRSEA